MGIESAYKVSNCQHLLSSLSDNLDAVHPMRQHQTCYMNCDCCARWCVCLGQFKSRCRSNSRCLIHICTGMIPDQKKLALVFRVDKGKWQSFATATTGCTSQYHNPSLPLPSGSQLKSLAAFKRSSSTESGTDVVPLFLFTKFFQTKF